MMEGMTSSTLAFLRAVNLPGRSFPSADIRRVAAEVGFSDPRTHAASGNLLVTGAGDRREVERTLEAGFLADRGFEVAVIAFAPDEFRTVAADAQELAAPEIERHYVYLLKDGLDDDAIARIAERDSAAGRTVVRGRAAHVLLGPGYRAGVVDPLNVAKLFGVATNRNASVIAALAEKWV